MGRRKTEERRERDRITQKGKEKWRESYASGVTKPGGGRRELREAYRHEALITFANKH